MPHQGRGLGLQRPPQRRRSAGVGPTALPRVERSRSAEQPSVAAQYGQSHSGSVLALGQGVELKFAAFVPQPHIGVSHLAHVFGGGVGRG